MFKCIPIEKPPLTHTQLVRYAGASGDFNPIHTVVPVGEQAGLGGVIAHGMLIMGFAGEAITHWFPRDKVRSFHVRFKEKSVPGEKLIIEGQIIEELETSGETRLGGQVIVKNEYGEIKCKGWFEIAK
ncbi:MaoC/PaaZ C-terminal domain-containing protein [Brevibacillus daliensis]|uniref:MaoC/PaaZ C-terminal domain-containing protein n=1 Tax=Brevibacillus daliensis TaxID=2892995 RepID=UPI001E3CC106|nr:MaoC/PaaZ C-terminal domain-containing protein [Brevibacillus daliensis]